MMSYHYSNSHYKDTMACLYLHRNCYTLNVGLYFESGPRHHSSCLICVICHYPTVWYFFPRTYPLTSHHPIWRSMSAMVTYIKDRRTPSFFQNLSHPAGPGLRQGHHICGISSRCSWDCARTQMTTMYSLWVLIRVLQAIFTISVTFGVCVCFAY